MVSRFWQGVKLAAYATGLVVPVRCAVTVLAWVGGAMEKPPRMAMVVPVQACMSSCVLVRVMVVVNAAVVVVVVLWVLWTAVGGLV